MSKFAGLITNSADTFRVELTNPITDDPLRDKAGNPAWVDVLSTDSQVARDHDAEVRKRLNKQAMKSRNRTVEDYDPLEDNIEKMARLTKGWHLVDPQSGEQVAVDCNRANAVELFTGAPWLFREVFAAAANAGNFMKKGSTTSSNGQSASSETAVA